MDWVEEFVCNPPGSPYAKEPFNFDLSPWCRFILRSTITEWRAGRLKEVGIIKASATSITAGFLINFLLYVIKNQPCDVIGMLPNDNIATRFLRTKLKGTVRNSPNLEGLIDMSPTRNGNTQHLVNYAGGNHRVCGSGSSGELDADHVSIIYADELDRCESNADGQGHSYDKLMTRIKASRKGLAIGIGTPGNVYDSKMLEVWNRSDQRYFHVPCHKCGNAAPLHRRNIVYETVTDNGLILPKNVLYKCPFCSEHWSEATKRGNVRKLWEESTRDFNGTIGYSINACYSLMEDGTMHNMIAKFLNATKQAADGDESSLKVFINTYDGDAYERKNDNDLNLENLKQRESGSQTSCPAYPRGTVPEGVIFLTMFTDKQHNRLHSLVFGHGRGSEMWLIDRRVSFATVSTNDNLDSCWLEVSEFESQPFKHANGRQMFVEVSAYDGGDTPQSVYDFVANIPLTLPDGSIVKREVKAKRIVTNGSSWDNGQREIFTVPKKVEVTGSNGNSKLKRHGALIHQIGTFKAKSLLTERLKLNGCGDGRIHFYQGIEDDVCQQLLSEQLVPINPRVHRWVKRTSGRANEDFDCFVGGLYLSIYVLSANHKTAEGRLLQKQRKLAQADFFEVLEEVVENEKKAEPQVDIAKNTKIEKPPPRAARPKVVSRRNSTQFW